VKKKLLNIGKFLLFLSIGVLLLWLVYKDQVGFNLAEQTVEEISADSVFVEKDSTMTPVFTSGDLDQVETIIHTSFDTEEELTAAIDNLDLKEHQIEILKDYRIDRLEEMMASIEAADFFWVWLSLFFAILSHISRALRWRLQLIHLGYNASIKNSIFAVFVNYIANLAIPRIGEVTRCGVVKQYEKIPFTKSFGTVIAERTVDMVILLILTFIVMVTQYDVVLEFVNSNEDVKQKIGGLMTNTMVPILILSLLAGGVILFFVLRRHIRHFFLYKKVKEFILNLYEGFKSVWALDAKWKFIGHTLFIWAMYYLMTYVCLFSFEFTSNITPMEALALFVMSSFGMVAPVQGGIGAWHFMVTRTLFVFGIAIVPFGNAYALVAHSSQTLLLIFTGLVSIILLPLLNKRTDVPVEK
jgi:uncharacterized protein (TIRG00374 family)